MHEKLLNFKKKRANAFHISCNAEKTSWKGCASSINGTITFRKIWAQVHKLNVGDIIHSITTITQLKSTA